MFNERCLELAQKQKHLYTSCAAIIRDNTMDDKLMYIPNNNQHIYSFFCRLELMVEKFEHNCFGNQPITTQWK